METFGMFMLFVMSMLGIACMVMFLYFGMLILRMIRKATRWVRSAGVVIDVLPAKARVTPLRAPIPVHTMLPAVKPRRRHVIKVVTYVRDL